jgi:hypothetical protein
MTTARFDLSYELSRGNTRENRDRLTRWVGHDERRMAELMRLYLHGAWREAQLAAGVVTLVADEHPEMMDPWLPAMVKRMQDRHVHNAVVRTGMHVLQVVEIPRRLAGRVAQICFDALEDVSQPIAVRVFAMTVLVNLCVGKKRCTEIHRGKEKLHEGKREFVAEPELAREVELAITAVLPYGTGAFTSRAKRELKRLQRCGVPVGSTATDLNNLSTLYRGSI